MNTSLLCGIVLFAFFADFRGTWNSSLNLEEMPLGEKEEFLHIRYSHASRLYFHAFLKIKVGGEQNAVGERIELFCLPCSS